MISKHFSYLEGVCLSCFPPRRRGALLLAGAALFALPGCVRAQVSANEDGEKLLATVTAKNPADIAVKDGFFKTHDEALMALLAGKKPFHVERDGKPVQAEVRDEDADGKPEYIFMVADFAPGESADFTVESGPAAEDINVKRTQAQISVAEGGEFKYEKQTDGTMKHVYHGGKFVDRKEWDVPAKHTDHSFDVRMEGPIWESDLAAYRIYEDWRNAVDYTGKLTNKMVLQDAGQHDFEEYHHPAPWGMDVLKVGDSLGLGTVGWWDGTKATRVAITDALSCKVSIDGNLCSEVQMHYAGWQVGKAGPSPVPDESGKIANTDAQPAKIKTDLDGKLTIHAGSRLTRYSLSLGKDLDNLCTGLVKMPDGKLIPAPEAKKGWTWMATWGVQSLYEPKPDELGLAIFYRAEDAIKVAEDKLSHVVVLKPTDRKLTYYLAGAWIQEAGGGMKNGKPDFEKFLNETVKQLDSPIETTTKLAAAK